MIDLLELFRDGGPIQYLILLIGLAGLGLTVVLAMVSARVRVPSATHLIAPAAMVGLGILGTRLGLSMVRQVLPNASDVVRPVLAAQGISISLYTSIFAALLTGGILLLAACLTGGALALRPTGDDEAKEASVRTEMLGGIGLLAATACATLGWGAWLSQQAIYWSALGKAAPEHRAAMMAYALQNAGLIVPVAIAAIAVFLVGGAAIVATRRDTLTRFGMVSLGVTGALALWVSLGLLTTHIGVSDVHAATHVLDDGTLPGMPNAPEP